MPGWLDSGPTLTEAQTTLTDIAMVGQYAVAPDLGGRPPHRLLHVRAPARGLPLRRGRRAARGSRVGRRRDRLA